jgi:putative nucleotidyltransferase with HDIG domain
MDRIEKLKERLQKLEILIHINKVINSTLETKILLNRIMHSAAKLLKAERSSLYLVTPRTKQLVFEVATGDEEGKVKQFKLKKGEGFAGYCALHKEPLLIPNVRKDPRWCPKVDEISGFTTKSLICVPLLNNRREVIGVLEVLNKLNNSFFTKEDLELLLDLSEQVQIALNNAKLYQELESLFISTVKSLATAIDAKDPYTRGHSERVTKICGWIAHQLRLSSEKRKDLELSALLHDIGKIGISEKILGKPTKLTPGEKRKIQKHSLIGAQILGHIKQLRLVIPAIKHHHERFDGKGYPCKLKRREIPLFSRIIAVGDAFDAMTSNRPYRRALSAEVAKAEIRKSAGTQFDPIVVDAFFEALKKIII